MDITGKIETQDTPEFINSFLGREKAWRARDSKKYCIFHPHIHKDNEKDILLKDGSTSKTVKKNIEVKNFKYCPRCFTVATI